MQIVCVCDTRAAEATEPWQHTDIGLRFRFIYSFIRCGARGQRESKKDWIGRSITLFNVSIFASRTSTSHSRSERTDMDRKDISSCVSEAAAAPVAVNALWSIMCRNENTLKTRQTQTGHIYLSNQKWAATGWKKYVFRKKKKSFLSAFYCHFPSRSERVARTSLTFSPSDPLAALASWIFPLGGKLMAWLWFVIGYK